MSVSSFLLPPSRRLVVVTLLVPMLLAIALLPRSAPGPVAWGDERSVSTVRVTANDVVVTGANVKEGAELALYEVGAEVSAPSWRESEPIATTNVEANGTYTLTAPRIAAGRDRLYSGYVVAIRGEGGPKPIQEQPRYAEVFDFPATNDFTYPKTLGKKGLQVKMAGDAKSLGVQHAAVNVGLTDLMRKEEADSTNTIRFESGGRTFFFDKGATADLDKEIETLSDSGMLVNLIMLVADSDDPNSPDEILAHPDSDRESGAAVLGFNTVTANGIAHLRAVSEFLAERYTREDQAHGRAVGFIVGNEIDSQWSWSNSGDKTLSEFLDAYVRALRTVAQATRKSYADARTYVSLDHAWTRPTLPDGNPDPNRPTRYYSARAVLDRLAAMTRRTGDFGWNVAHHPYPEDLADPAFWNDESAQPSPASPLVTFKNIQVLPQYLKKPELAYAGKPRRVIQSEQGCNTPGTNEAAQRLQAACYAYAYYKIKFTDGIDSFILHRHVDHKQEGGLRLGLWAWDEASEDPADPPGEKKYVYDVFSYIDTKRSLEVTEFAKPIIGISDWSEVIPGFDPDELADRPLPVGR